MKNKMMLVAASAVGALSAAPAFAVSIVDYSALGTSVTAELTPALAAVIPIAGTILAVSVGWKLVKRFL